MSGPKITNSCRFYLFSNSCKINGGQDGDHLSRRHRPPAKPPPVKYTSSCREYQRITLTVKYFRNTATYEKPQGEVPSPTPPPLVHGESMTLCVRPRVHFIIYSAKLTLYLSHLFVNVLLQNHKHYCYEIQVFWRNFLRLRYCLLGSSARFVDWSLTSSLSALLVSLWSFAPQWSQWALLGWDTSSQESKEVACRYIDRAPVLCRQTRPLSFVPNSRHGNKNIPCNLHPFRISYKINALVTENCFFIY